MRPSHDPHPDTPAQTLLEISDLSVRFATREVVRRVSFSVRRGETLALVGESGSGKSLTALSILQLLPDGAQCSGRIALDGVPMIGAAPAVLRQMRGGMAGMIFQEPMTSLNPLHRIGRQVGEALALHGRKPDKAAVAHLLRQAGFADAETRLHAFPHQLSGGQRQRVMIAMALANDPALLIADEPTTALDVTIQAQILDLLAEQKRARQLGLLLITHDLTVVRRHADRVCVMRHGEIVEQGAVKDVFSTPAHPYTRMLLDAEPTGTASPLPGSPPELASARNLKVYFPIRGGLLRRVTGQVRAVDDVTLTVREGETLGLVGESGSGKSTIGQALLRLQPSEGVIRFAGRDLQALGERSLRPLRRDMQIVFQDPFGSLSPRMSVREIIGEGLAVHEPRQKRTEREARVARALEEVGLPQDAAERYPHEFSGGQRQRIAIARALVLQPRFIVLDEPTSALDMSVQAQIVTLLRGLQARYGMGYLFISHDLRVVRALAHRVAVLRRGVVVEEGETAAIFERPADPYTRSLIAAAFQVPSG
ncbi:ABC transporter ATP-binding protein [Granulibacter bethesdensis]|uniref:ABC transporter ATP-binding protein n=1 Tax=Granulibacter bethesdensis TaxID=364410 RepID=UPI00090C0683|nr:ABC transporter ATP-binding protein [Granulibacter bethesdensis]APH60326.1 Oligopeptide transport ATP-binding protein oppF [Granulibacter bethesdensis]